MIHGHGHLEKKLRKVGRSAPAEILLMRTEGHNASMKRTTDDDLSGVWTDAWMRLRVMPPGESPFEVEVRTRIHTFKYQGDTVPVLYNPDDHDEVFVDAEADLAAHDARRAALPHASVDDVVANAAALRERTAALASTTDTLAAIMRARAAGDDAEVARLKAEMAPRPAGGPPAGGDDRLERLAKLADLRDRGVLTPEEFAAEKARVLGLP